jgi:hypothetical protein
LDLYSLTLGLALVAIGVSVLAALSARIGLGKTSAAARTWPARMARVGALASLLLVAFSFLFHLLTGHRPGTPQAMGTTEFVLEHPAFVAVAVVAVLVLCRPGRPEGRRRRTASGDAPPPG